MFIILSSEYKLQIFSKDKFILTVLHILLLFEYRIPRCTCSESYFYYLLLSYKMVSDIRGTLFSKVRH